MSSQQIEQIEYSEQPLVQQPRRPGPAFGELGPPPELAEKAEEPPSSLNRRTEVALAIAIGAPVLAAYAALAYAAFLAIDALA